MPTQTQTQVQDIMNFLKKIQIDPNKQLKTDQHSTYMQEQFQTLGKSIIHFEPAQPWLYFYFHHTKAILGHSLDETTKIKIIQALKYCMSQGAFGGGYLQIPHLAPTYSAFLELLEIGPQALNIIDREQIHTFFKSVKKNGHFEMHKKGEKDLRGTFIVTIITKLLRLPEDVLQGVAQTIIKSQTYEGGIANIEGGEAHGGYTFCGVGALSLLGRLQDLDISRLMFWLSRRQVQFGGFNGRTNKLIDSCYSFWIGSCFNIINDYFQGRISIQQHLLYCQEDLQKYLLLYCQDEDGGLTDKPGKKKDIYHTCYALSGLSLSQSYDIVVNKSEVVDIDPVYNVSCFKMKQARKAMGEQ